jgi:pyruvate formate lyase activating enzyme
MAEGKLARHFRLLESGKVECLLCPVHCKLGEGRIGICFGRKAVGGKLYATNYGEVVSVAVDPIEKKPLFHFYPGSQILSVGPNGCNLRCRNCQNWGISQDHSPTRYLAPDELIAAARNANSIGIAYTYSEPLIWWEYIFDTAQISREKGLKTVLVSNGYVNEEPWREIVHLIDAMNIDVKSMQPEFYRKVCKGKLEDVLRTAEIAAESGVALEVTNLVIPNLNDSDEDINALVDWLAGVDPNIPLHFSRYFPHYKMDEPTTPTATLQKVYDIASRKLKYVYLGNIELPGTSDTRCPQCSHTLVRRSYYRTAVLGIEKGVCVNCGRKADLIL